MCWTTFPNCLTTSTNSWTERRLGFPYPGGLSNDHSPSCLAASHFTVRPDRYVPALVTTLVRLIIPDIGVEIAVANLIISILHPVKGHLWVPHRTQISTVSLHS